MITILSVDGGGIRGIIPATVLAEIERRTGRPICTMFDYIAGTSTGGIITAMLTVPGKDGKPKYTAEEIKNLYIKFGRTVFSRTVFRRIATLGGLIGPRYPVKPLENLLHSYLGDARLHSTLTNVIISAYDMETRAPWFFKTTYAMTRRTIDSDPLLSQAVRATTAAPSFFSPLGMPGHCFIDGGVFANNPTLCAYAEAWKNAPGTTDFLVVSLGTGENREQTNCGEARNWGSIQWMVPMFGVFMNSSGATVNYQMKAIISSPRYYRYQVLLGENSEAMDDASDENIKRLEGYGRQMLSQNAPSIEKLCKMLKDAPNKANRM